MILFIKDVTVRSSNRITTAQNFQPSINYHPQIQNDTEEIKYHLSWPPLTNARE